MIQGLYNAANGMMAVEARQESIANNIANASTPGYKSQGPVQMGFYTFFSDSLRRAFVFNGESAPAGGVKLVETYPNLRAGVLRETDNPLDLALRGPGFFVVDTPAGERFTRAGGFTVDSEGHLATSTGYKVMDVNGGPISVQDGVVNVATDGGVTVDGAPAGRIRLVEFDQPERLLREGDSLFNASEAVLQASMGAVDTELEQKHLEMSNVHLPTEMVRLMMGMRAYEANQRVIHAHDSTMGKLIDQVAMP